MTQGSAIGDRLAEAWPARNRDRQALAEDSLRAGGINARPCSCACGVMLPIATNAGPNPFASSSTCAAAARMGMYNRRLWR